MYDPSSASNCKAQVFFATNQPVHSSFKSKSGIKANLGTQSQGSSHTIGVQTDTQNVPSNRLTSIQDDISSSSVSSQSNCPPVTQSNHQSNSDESTQCDHAFEQEPNLQEGVIELISSTCWYIPGKMSDVKTQLLVDSGSTYTIMDHDLFQAISEDKRPKLEKISLVLRSATGEKLMVHGQAKMEIVLGNQNFQFPVKIVSLGDKSCILGLDFMGKHECILNMGKGLLQIGSSPRQLLKLHKQNTSKCARIQVASKICIPPSHEMIISGKINQRHRNFDEPIGSIEQTSTLLGSKGLMVAKAVVNTQQSHVPVKVANFTPNTIVLDQGYTIAMLHPVDADQVKPFNKCDTNLNKVVTSPNAELPDHLKPILDGIYTEATETEKAQVKQLLIEYQDCFMTPDGRLGSTNIVQHRILTGDAKPIKQKLRIPPMHLQKAVDAELDRMLEAGIIEPSQSAWASNLVVVPKKDGTIRVCADMRAVNQAITNHSAYPLPRIEECLDCLSGSQFYSSLDLCQGYHQVEIHPDDRDKCAIITRKGLFQYCKMPFGLCNSPSSFENLMEIVLKNLQWERCVLYLDDILTFGKTFDETLENLKCVLERLRGANLRLKPSKCKLMVTSVPFLGFIVDKDGVHCDYEKIQCVAEWERPQSTRQIRSFVGFCG